MSSDEQALEQIIELQDMRRRANLIPDPNVRNTLVSKATALILEIEISSKITPQVYADHTIRKAVENGFFSPYGGRSRSISSGVARWNVDLNTQYDEGISISKSTLSALIKAADSDHEAFGFASTLAARHLDDDRAMPEPLKLWASMVLRGHAPLPKRGGDRTKFALRDKALSAAASTLSTKFRLPLRGGYDSASPSVCGVLATAASKHGHAMTADAIYKALSKPGNNLIL